MSIKFLLDGKIYDPSTKELSTLNIALKAGRVAALGYLDEDETAEQVSLKNCLIVNNAFNVFDSFNVMDGQHVVELLHHGGFDAATELVVARVSVSEFMFVLQELSVLADDVQLRLHLVLTYVDSDVLDVLEARELPQGVSVGVLVDDVPVELIERLHGMVMASKVVSLSTKSDDHICTWLMAMFGKKAPALMAQLFEIYAVDVLGLSLQPMVLGNQVSFVAVQVEEPYGIVFNVPGIGKLKGV